MADSPQTPRPFPGIQTSRQLDLLVEQLGLLAPLPPSFLHALSRCWSRELSTEDLQRCLQADVSVSSAMQSLAEKLLGRSVESSSQALAEVPLHHCLALLTWHWVYAPLVGPRVESYRPLWRQTLRQALLAEQAAGDVPPCAAFLSVLLHDVGRAALLYCLPKAYNRLLRSDRDPSPQVETQLLAADHLLLGRRLAMHWQLPAYVQDCVWLHHQPPDSLPDDLPWAGLIKLVQWARFVSDHSAVELAQVRLRAKLEQMSAAIGVSAEDVSEMLADLPIQLASLEVIDLSAPLNSSGPRPFPGGETRAEASHAPHDLLGLLMSKLRPETPLPQVCRLIAQSFASAVSVAGISPALSEPNPCFAFALPGPTCVAASSGPAGSQCIRSWECRTWVSPPPEEMLDAHEVLSRLIKDDSWKELLGGAEYDCLILAFDGRMTGGILLPRGQLVDRREIAPLVDLARFTISSCVERAEADRLTEQFAAAMRRLSQVQQALTEAQALASVGEMAAGAAHEMNNPLTVISGRAQLLAGRLKEPKDRQDMELIVRKAEELSELATQLLSFTQPQEPHAQVVDLRDLLAQAAREAQNQPMSKPRCQSVDIDIEPDCCAVRCDAQQLQEVLAELLANAATASKGQATVRMQAGNADNVVRLRVIDNGPGMNAATLAMAFVPFFSSRPAGRGRGLGLPQALRKIQANGGRMGIESQSGAGTTVTIELPRAEPA